MLRHYLPLAILMVLMGVGFANGWHEQLTLSNLIKNRIALRTFIENQFVLAMLAYCGLYIVAVALSFPGASWITVAGGFVFGWLLAGTLTAFAATIGATIIFWIAKSSLGEALSKKAGPFIHKLGEGFRENGFSYLLFLRLVPLFPFFVINLVPAFFSISTPTYVVATFIGILPGTFAYALFGEGLDSLIKAQEMANPGCADRGDCDIDLSAAVTPEIVAAMVALVVVSLMPIAIKKYRDKYRDRGSKD